MSYRSQDLLSQLKATRDALGISQRALSARSGLTQAHISQIERGSIDPSISSFIELARSLELEVALVPRKFIPAIQGIIAGASTNHSDAPVSRQAAAIAKFQRLSKTQRELHGSSSDLARIEGSLRLLRDVPMRSAELTALRGLYDLLKQDPVSAEAASIVREIAAKLQSVRSRLADTQDANEPRPAYVFDDEADDA